MHDIHVRGPTRPFRIDHRAIASRFVARPQLLTRL